MEWYDLQPGDTLEVNPDFQSRTSCTSCLGFAADTLYIIEMVTFSDCILAGIENKYIDLVLKCEDLNSARDVRIGCDGKILRDCISRDYPPIFRLVALAEERDGNQMDRSQTR